MNIIMLRMLNSKMEELVKNLMEHLEKKDDEVGEELARELLEHYLMVSRILIDTIISLGSSEPSG